MPQSHQSERLERRAREIVDSLGGTWRRNRGMCRCPAHDDRTPSLSVSLGRRAILFHCFAGCSNDEVIAALGRRGVRARELFDGSGCEPLPEIPRKETIDRNASRLWRGADALRGSPAETYLLRRGLTQFSSDLRFHPRTPLGPRGAVRFLPAMLAAVRSDLGVIAVHRTFLDARACLAGFERPKRALGSLQHGAVRLAIPREGRLGLAEGIETALSAMQLFGVPCWATLGNERFGLVTIPESVRELHLFVDNDPGGDLAEERAREAYACDGRRIAAMRPASLDEDWNDVLMNRALAAT